MENNIDRSELEAALARKEKKTTLQGIVSQVKTESAITETLIEEIIGNISAPLDAFIRRVEATIHLISRGDLRRISENDLELMCLELPTVMYNLNDALEDLAGLGIVAQSHKKLLYDEVFAKQEGTIPDKQNAATLIVANEILVEKLVERARMRLKSKLDRGLDLFSGLKKVMDSRKVAMEVFRRDYASFNATDKPGERASGGF